MSWSDEKQNGESSAADGGSLDGSAQAASTSWRWGSDSFVRLSIAVLLLITVADSLLGPRIILIGLLIVGPCCALFSGRRSSTALVSTAAVGLALLLAIPDGIWDTVAQLAFATAIVLVAVACTWAAGVIGSLSRG